MTITRADTCYLFDRGYGPEQWVSVRIMNNNNNSFIAITAGEAPTSEPGLSFIYNDTDASLPCIKDGIFNSNNCNKGVVLSDVLGPVIPVRVLAKI